MVFLATWVRLGLGKTHVAARGFTYYYLQKVITNCYEFYCLKNHYTNVFNQYVDPFQVSDVLVDPLPEYSDVST